MIYGRIKNYKFEEVQEILNSEYPIDYTITDVGLSAFMYACSLPDQTPPQRKQYNLKMLQLIWSFGPDLKRMDKFRRTCLHIAVRANNETALKFIVSKDNVQ